jgi:NADH:ubiquinone oxidoreductase subunit 4 (subunit M)
MLTLIQKVFYGATSEAVDANSGIDLYAREQLILWPLAILMLIMGVVPNLWLTGIETQVRQVIGLDHLASFTPDCIHHPCKVVILSSRQAGVQR